MQVDDGNSDDESNGSNNDEDIDDDVNYDRILMYDDDYYEDYSGDEDDYDVRML